MLWLYNVKWVVLQAIISEEWINHTIWVFGRQRILFEKNVVVFIHNSMVLFGWFVLPLQVFLSTSSWYPVGLPHIIPSSAFSQLYSQSPLLRPQVSAICNGLLSRPCYILLLIYSLSTTGHKHNHFEWSRNFEVLKWIVACCSKWHIGDVCRMLH